MLSKTELLQQYLACLLAGNRKAALNVAMGAYLDGYGITDIYMDIFQEALYEIGRLWESNRITVADEHMGTAITQFVMSNIYQQMQTSERHLGRAVITGVQGELHQIGANMVADLMENDGWDVIFLGTNVPPEGVMNTVRQHRADLLGISSTMHANHSRVIHLIDAVKSESGNSVQIMVGGGAFRGLEKLPQEFHGCLVARDLKEALELTRREKPPAA
jgi:MerR family transcriptional regulator, light-induced transcriptional regulator